MNVKILTLVVVLLLSLLCSCGAGSMGSAEQGKEVEEGSPQTCRLEEETSKASPLSQGAHAVLEQAQPKTPSSGSDLSSSFAPGEPVRGDLARLARRETSTKPPGSSSNSSSVQIAGQATHLQRCRGMGGMGRRRVLRS
ncbi:hypothetical protein GN956_G15129 [Arapaima gigas]